MSPIVAVAISGLYVTGRQFFWEGSSSLFSFAALTQRSPDDAHNCQPHSTMRLQCRVLYISTIYS